MLTKLQIRKLIDCTKEEYNNSGDKTLLVNIALMKGLYIAVGGTKYITMPQKLDTMVCYASIVFKHKLNIMNKMQSDKVTSFLIKSLMSVGKKPENIVGSTIPTSNNDISVLMINLIFSEYTEDMMINSINIRNTTLELLQRLDEREVGV